MSATTFTGSIGSNQFAQFERHTTAARPGTYRVLLDLRHACLGHRYQVLRADAVLDDFGDLVFMADENGRVVFE